MANKEISEARAKYQADIAAYPLRVLLRVAKGTKYEAQVAQALKLIEDIK